MTGDIEDAEWEEIPGNNGNLSKLTSPTPDFKGAQTQASAPSAKSALGGWWKDMPMLGKAILIVFGLSFLPSFCSSDPSAPSSGTQTAQADPGAAAGGPSSDQMLSDWSEFAIGEARTTRFGLTDGSGAPGEFCSASVGETIMAFGPPPSSNGEPEAYESFIRLDSADNTAAKGFFQFNRADGTLIAHGLIGQRLDNEEPVPVLNFTMKVAADPDGTVIIDGRAFHHCIP